jgi:hypothetical protein
VSEELLNAIADDGALGGVLDLVRADRGLRDLQLRRVRGPECWATLYVGLVKLLDIRERNGRFRLDAHETARELGQFDERWRQAQPVEDLQNCWQEVLTYLGTAISAVRPEHIKAEGAVQAALCSGVADEFRVVDREAALTHVNTAVRSGTMAPVENALNEALSLAGREEPWWPSARGKVSFGGELDVLAIDDVGRLLVVEVKPANAVAAIAKSPAQVALYATLWSMWLAETDDSTEVLQGMLDQRARLGLGRAGPIVPPTAVTPVVAIGTGKLSKEALPRLRQVAEAVQPVLQAQQSLQPLELWFVDDAGRVLDTEVLG